MAGDRAITSHIRTGIFVVLAIVSLGVSRVYIAPERVLAILLSKYVAVTPVWTPAEALIVMNVRLPRICAALMVDAALADAGSAYQNLFRNPIVSPDILGVSDGVSLRFSAVFSRSRALS
ncbi:MULTISPECIES: iron chelate uptake ABC transporter family permease subunit [unclassified Enterobacter]|uniref:iron chelate uptake ABC transporter family permease subunit n=1 Tax=unclassified Enterobacter TaxID=2608935 RepID=UPI001C8507C9|nr:MULTISPECIES: iron chelate uptake ABC transporter family permease subunit [unclassified Enterobacter]